MQGYNSMIETQNTNKNAPTWRLFRGMAQRCILNVPLTAGCRVIPLEAQLSPKHPIKNRDMEEKRVFFLAVAIKLLLIPT